MAAVANLQARFAVRRKLRVPQQGEQADRRNPCRERASDSLRAALRAVARLEAAAAALLVPSPVRAKRQDILNAPYEKVQPCVFAENDSAAHAIPPERDKLVPYKI